MKRNFKSAIILKQMFKSAPEYFPYFKGFSCLGKKKKVVDNYENATT